MIIVREYPMKFRALLLLLVMVMLVFDTFDPLAPHLGKEMVDWRNAYFYCD